LLGLTYSTTREQMENVCLQLRQLCEKLDDIHNEGIEVYFFEFGESSLNIHIVCYANAQKKSEYLRIREELNLEIMKILDDNGVSCAFPSRSIYFETPIPQAENPQPVVFPAEKQPVAFDLRNAKGVRIEKAPEK